MSAWRDTLRIIADFPWFGTGPGQLRHRPCSCTRPATATSIYMQAHNDYLQMLAEGGLLVAVPVAIAIVAIVPSAIRRRLRGRLEPR